MDQLDKIIQHLQQLPGDFYGQITVRIREGRAVLIVEERTIQLDNNRTQQTLPSR